jgi:hypothetical protein
MRTVEGKMEGGSTTFKGQYRKSKRNHTRNNKGKHKENERNLSRDIKGEMRKMTRNLKRNKENI